MSIQTPSEPHDDESADAPFWHGADRPTDWTMREPGNSLVFGQSASGKSRLMNELMGEMTPGHAHG